MQIMVAKNWGKGDAGGFDLSAVGLKLDVDGYSIRPEGEGSEPDENAGKTSCEIMAERMYSEAASYAVDSPSQ